MSNKSLDVQLKGILNEYEERVQDVTDKAITKTARESVQRLKNTSPVGYTGEYAAGWKVKKTGRLTQVVHNKVYRLTHLLNNGHIVRNKYGEYGRVNGDNHIGKVEQWAGGELVETIERGLN